MHRRLPAPAVLALAGVGLLWVGVASGNGIGPVAQPGTPRLPELRPPTHVPSQPPVDAGMPNAAPPTPDGTGHPVLGYLVLALGVALLAWLAWWLGRRLVRGKRVAAAVASSAEPAEVVVDAGQVAAQLRTSLDELATSRHLHGAVVACWRRLEELAARSGAERQPWQSTSEYVLDVMGATPAAPQDLQELAGLYRTAVYSTHQPDDADRERAVSCLTRLAERLEETGHGRA